MLSDITWTADPAIFTIGSKEIRWYSLMFIIGFGIGYKIVERMWRRESINPKWIDPLLYYTLIGTVVGARLGHCLFYDPGYSGKAVWPATAEYSGLLSQSISIPNTYRDKACFGRSINSSCRQGSLPL